jgi:biuret amidohydrolase
VRHNSVGVMQHAFGLTIPETLAEAVRPDIPAIVVYDMQVGILRQLADGTAIVARGSSTAAAAMSRASPF